MQFSAADLGYWHRVSENDRWIQGIPQRIARGCRPIPFPDFQATYNMLLGVWRDSSLDGY